MLPDCFISSYPGSSNICFFRRCEGVNLCMELSGPGKVFQINNDAVGPMDNRSFSPRVAPWAIILRSVGALVRNQGI